MPLSMPGLPRAHTAYPLIVHICAGDQCSTGRNATLKEPDAQKVGCTKGRMHEGTDGPRLWRTGVRMVLVSLVSLEVCGREWGIYVKRQRLVLRSIEESEDGFAVLYTHVFTAS